MPTKTKRQKHQNDRRRITATERADAWFSAPVANRKTLAKAFEKHAAATLARSRAKDKAKFRAMTKRLDELMQKKRKGK